MDIDLFVLLLMAFAFHIFKLSCADLKYRKAFKKTKAEIFLKSRVSRHMRNLRVKLQI